LIAAIAVALVLIIKNLPTSDSTALVVSSAGATAGTTSQAGAGTVGASVKTASGSSGGMGDASAAGQNVAATGTGKKISATGTTGDATLVEKTVEKTVGKTGASSLKDAEVASTKAADGPFGSVFGGDGNGC
jgi:hypothetical protein